MDKEEEKAKKTNKKVLTAFLGSLIGELVDVFHKDARGDEIVRAVMKAGTKVIDEL